MFSQIAKLFRPQIPPLDRLRRIADAYDERGGDEDTLQGALANAVVLIRSEANRNGLANWSENYEECIGILLKYLCEDAAALPAPLAEEMRRDLLVIQEMGLGLRPIEYREIDRVAQQVLDWCEAHPRPIFKPTGTDFWYP